MHRRSSFLALVALAVSGFLVGCGGTPIVGVMLPSTGAAASYGGSIESGINLALTEARDRGALPEGFEVLWVDTASDPARAVEELRAMVAERDVKLVIAGATSAEALAIIPELDDLDVVCLSPSASAPGLAKMSRMFFRIYPSDELEGHTAGTFLFEKLGKERVVLMTGDTEYTRGILPEFLKQYEEALGGEVVGEVSLIESDWRTNASAMLNDSALEAVYVIGYAEEILNVVLFLAERGYQGRIITTSAVYSGDILRQAGSAAEGLMFPLPPFDRTSEKEPVVGFVNRYMDTFVRPPDVFAAHGYDAMSLAIQVMTLANPPATLEILKALNFGVTEQMGVTGPILFDDHGDVKHYPQMFIYKEGQVLTYQRYLDTERRRIINQVQDLLQSGD